MGIKGNIAFLREEIAKIATKSGRISNEIKLLAVSKTFPKERVLEAYEYGHRLFGENKIQELEEKVKELPKDIEWHFIGHLQSNKTKKAVELASYIHSIDSAKLIKKINRIAGKIGKRPKLLIEVNISGEKSKDGVSPDNVDELITIGLECKNIVIVGFMTIAPLMGTKKEIRDVFYKLRGLRDQTEDKFNIKLPELSMGMSSDYKIAIEEGATIVRIGSAIFGSRKKIK